MPQDAFTLRFVAKELNDALQGGKINRINQPDKEELSLLIYTGKRTLKLVLNVNASDCGAYFSDEERENPLTAPNFCMLLRKHLQNAQILSVEQVAFERILAFRLFCHSDFSSCERVLYAEIMGKYSNLVLAENDRILGALKTTSLEESHRRVLLTGATYRLPNPQDKVSPLDLPALSALFEGNDDPTGQFVFEHVAGLAPSTAQWLVDECIFDGFASYLHAAIFHHKPIPCVLERKGAPVDFYAYLVEGATRFDTLSEAQSYFYAKKRAKKKHEQLKRKLENAVKTARKKQEKRLSQILDKYQECEEMELNRIRGELITANLYRLERGMRGCELQNYYDEKGGTLKIPLDITLTPSQNAQRYYKKYQKQKRTLDALAPQERELRAELNYLERLFSAVQTAEEEEDLRAVEEEMLSAELLKAPPSRTKKKKAEIPFRTFEREGFRILAGRNNLQNDRLVRASAPNDIWLHTQKYHSSHVVVQTEGKPLPDGVLLYAARLCARYSDGKAGSKIPVDYCQIKYVKKPSGAKAGFVIYTDYQTLLVDPLEE